MADIRVLKRATQGVTLISLKDDSLAAVQRITEDDVDDDEAASQAAAVPQAAGPQGQENPQGGESSDDQQ